MIVSRKSHRFLFMLQLLLVCSLALPAFSNNFKSIENDYSQFKVNTEQKKFRHNYENLIRRYKNFVEKNPNSKDTPYALLNIAKLKNEIANVSRVKGDFSDAKKSYLVALAWFKNHAISDEALFSAAKIEHENAKSPINALKLLKKYLNGTDGKARYPKSSRLVEQIQRQAGNKASSPSVSLKNDAVINSVRFESGKKRVRVTVEGGGQSKLTRGEIQQSEQQPRRVFFDLYPALLSSQVKTVLNVSRNDVYRIRVGEPRDNVVRVVLELSEDVNIDVLSEDNKLILDLSQGERFEDKPKTVAVTTPNSKTHRAVSKSEVKKSRVIVLDPGHGGEDTGAVGSRGLKEKTVTLQIARRIKTFLEKKMSNVKVHLTRTRDKTLPLSERTQIANRLKADLFISIHANAAPNRRAQGIETYYLNISSDRYAIRLAARENAMSESEISNLEFILADLAMKSNVSDSIHLGQVVQDSMFAKVKEKWRDAKDLGLKHALFFVLMGTKMPAILIETSFISNRTEESRLKSASYQNALAKGVVRGVVRYFENRQAMYVP